MAQATQLVGAIGSKLCQIKLIWKTFAAGTGRNVDIKWATHA